MIFISLISGLFKNIIMFFSLLLIHEMGHFLMAKMFGWKVDRICFYPYGGVTKFCDDLNKPKIQELIIMLMGPIFQILFFLVMIRFLTIKEVDMLRSYHYSILFFNLLPIYPLDGGKLLNIILNYFLSFRRSFKITIYISYGVICFMFSFLLKNRVSLSLSLLLIIGLVICKLTSELKKEKYYFNKFLLERHLNHYRFSKIKTVKHIKDVSRDYKHVFYRNGKTRTEKEELSKYFQY